MSTKDKLLELLDASKGSYVSGADAAARLSMSRTAIWKAVSALRCDGYVIEAVPNRGYMLSDSGDVLSAHGIEKYLKADGISLSVVTSTGSTNSDLRAAAAAGAPNGSVLVSGHQTHGRGRIGRSFCSPPDTGLYMSILLRPENCSAERARSFTTLAAVAVCEAAEAVSGCTARIKWVNDIYIKGRKAAGILTEASFGMENGLLDYAVLGIGVNVYEPKDGFPDELRGIAGAVFDDMQEDGRNRIAAEILNRLCARLDQREPSAHAEDYRSRCFVIGQNVLVMSGSDVRRAFAEDTDDECRLIVRYEDGTMQALDSGEISVRLDKTEGD